MRLVKDGTKKGRYVYRGKTFVNAALLRAGAAQGKELQTLTQATALTGAESQAQTAKRGLWTTCAATTTPTPPTTPPTPAADIERARKDLAGRVFTRISTTTFGSAESRLHLCSNGRFVEDVETYSDFGPPTHYRYEGSWEVIQASYTADVVSGRVRRLNQDGSEGFIEFVAQGGKVFTDGSEVSVQASGSAREKHLSRARRDLHARRVLHRANGPIASGHEEIRPGPVVHAAGGLSDCTDGRRG